MIWWRRLFAAAFFLASLPFVLSFAATPPLLLIGSDTDLAYERQWNRQFVSIAEYATQFSKTHQRMPSEEEFYDFGVARSIGGPLLDGVRVAPYAEVRKTSPLVAARLGKPPSGEFFLVAPHFDSVEYYASWSGRSTAEVDQPQQVKVEVDIRPLAIRAGLNIATASGMVLLATGSERRPYCADIIPLASGGSITISRTITGHCRWLSFSCPYSCPSWRIIHTSMPN